MKTALIMLSLLPATLAGCAALKPHAAAQRADRPLEARVLGLLSENAVNAPATVRVGEDFAVKIMTTGGGCERAADTGVLLTEDSATLMVYDFTSATRPGVACTMILKHLAHTATLRFTKPGAAVIRVWGRRTGADAPLGGAPVVLERRA